jgi:ABC-type transport system involved in multi-copper enzyme maturation permease subunit
VGGASFFSFVSLLGIISVVFGTVIGAIFGAEDVASGTLRYILLTGFSRLRLFLIRIPVLAIVAIGAALPAFVLLLIGALILPHAGEPSVTASDVGRLLLSLVLNVGIYALIAYGIGVAIRSTGGAIALALGLNLIGISLFNLITLAVPGVEPWLLDSALTRVSDGGDTSIAIAIVALIVWPAVFLAIGLVRALRTEA